MQTTIEIAVTVAIIIIAAIVFYKWDSICQEVDPDNDNF